MFDEISTGAESDIAQLTEIARQMVGRWGMSPAIGPIAVLPRDGSGPFLPAGSEVSPDTQRIVDAEVRRIVDESHKQVVALLEENRGKLDSLARRCSSTRRSTRRTRTRRRASAMPLAQPAEPLSAAARIAGRALARQEVEDPERSAERGDDVHALPAAA